MIGLIMGLGMALMLKHSQLGRFSQIETCLIALTAYGSYFLSNALRMSGIPLTLCNVRNCVSPVLWDHIETLRIS
jgi:sodium/hydrogen exchanger-like protein 6/7